jgi:hypothetical protein
MKSDYKYFLVHDFDFEVLKPFEAVLTISFFDTKVAWWQRKYIRLESIRKISSSKPF